MAAQSGAAWSCWWKHQQRHERRRDSVCAM